MPDAAVAVSLRPAAEADAARIAEIYAHHVLTGLATFETEPPDAAEMLRRHRELVARGFPYLVAESAGRVVGYAYAGPYRARAAYRYTVEDSIYLEPGAERRGIGSALLGALVDAAARAGFRQMIAVIGDSGNAASIRVHGRCGFRMAGTLAAVGFKFGRWVDSVLMQRALGDGAATAPDRG
ncbi:MAG: GNAT family N-acetyltransferase [Burkholderiales bacterium]|nr:GNAT family N-acetyltransferase [Burkholderiales bacterium]